jgi:hypothetical protein
MNVVDWYERIKVRHTTAPRRFFLVDTATGEIIIAVRRYIDSLSAAMLAPTTQQNRCFLLQHIIVFLRSRNLSIAQFAQRPAHHSAFSTWLADPFRAEVSGKISAIDKRNTAGALKKRIVGGIYG